MERRVDSVCLQECLQAESWIKVWLQQDYCFTTVISGSSVICVVSRVSKSTTCTAARPTKPVDSVRNSSCTLWQAPGGRGLFMVSELSLNKRPADLPHSNICIQTDNLCHASLALLLHVVYRAIIQDCFRCIIPILSCNMETAHGLIRRSHSS
jgi:hypothetical protein